jgi:hypothetical protein
MLKTHRVILPLFLTILFIINASQVKAKQDSFLKDGGAALSGFCVARMVTGTIVVL